ncbi:MAG: FkbM family methyltransferase [Rhizobiales bacterium]|nr:FkbM family methyltransferase [Hyphomicrobiales bacterium]
MSRSVARLLNALINGVCALQSDRQAKKTKSELIRLIEQGSTRTIDTNLGPLRFHAMRGANVASMVVRLNDDEPETLDWIRHNVKPGQTMWDIGACIGTMALYAALLPDTKILAFEPKATNFGLLSEHIAINNMSDRISAYCLALSDSQGLSELALDNLETGGALNSLTGTTNQFGGTPAAGHQAIPVMTIDGFCDFFKVPAPNHIKLDVDGIESAIIAGAAKTLPRVSSILIEIEGLNADEAAQRFEIPLAQAGFEEDQSWRNRGSGRNRLYQNKSL